MGLRRLSYCQIEAPGKTELGRNGGAKTPPNVCRTEMVHCWGQVAEDFNFRMQIIHLSTQEEQKCIQYAKLIIY